MATPNELRTRAFDAAIAKIPSDEAEVMRACSLAKIARKLGEPWSRLRRALSPATSRTSTPEPRGTPPCLVITPAGTTKTAGNWADDMPRPGTTPEELAVIVAEELASLDAGELAAWAELGEATRDQGAQDD